MEEEIITSSPEVTEHWLRVSESRAKGGAGLEWVCVMGCRPTR